MPERGAKGREEKKERKKSREVAEKRAKKGNRAGNWKESTLKGRGSGILLLITFTPLHSII